MTADETFARRADQVIAELYASQDQRRYAAHEVLMGMVDAGELTLEAVRSIYQELGTVALVTVMNVNPAIQAAALRKLERSMESGDA